MINLPVVENPRFFPPKLDESTHYPSYFILALSGFEERDKPIREVFRTFGTQNYKYTMVFIYDPFQEQHYDVKECFKKDNETPLEIPAFVVTTKHPNIWESQPKNCVRVNRGLISVLLKKGEAEKEGEMHLFDFITDLHAFCSEGKFKKVHQHVIEEKLLHRIKTVWKEAKGLVGVSFSFSH